MMTIQNSLTAIRSHAIRRTAFLLADSGNFRDWKAIECVLSIRYGVIESRRLLVDLSIRAELNRRCEMSRGRESSQSRLAAFAVDSRPEK